MADSWYVAKGKTKLGPFSREQLKGLAQSGQLQPTDMVLPTGSPKWMPASAVAGVFTRPQPAAAAPPKPTAPPKRAPSPKRTAATKPAAPAPTRRSGGKVIALVAAALAVCGCLVGVPVSLAAYFLWLAPASRPDASVMVAAATNAGETSQQLAVPEVPKTAPPTDPPTAKTPPTESPQVDLPKADPPRSDPSKADPPKADPPKADPPMADPPMADPPKTDVPNADPPNADPPKKNPPAGDQLTAEALQMVKQATVYLRVTLPDGRIVQGSGFLAGGPNIVLTN